MKQAKERAIITDKLVVEKTGKAIETWFKILDKKGAKEMKHIEIFNLISNTDGLKPLGEWNHNLLATTYEWSRGIKERGQKEDGFEISVSKTIQVPINTLYNAWLDEKLRNKWLEKEKLLIRKATTNKSARITWSDNETSLSVDFYSKASDKSQVVVQHLKIPDAKKAVLLKTFWSQKLDVLKTFLKNNQMDSNRHTDHRLLKKLFRPVDNSPLIIFRMLFGFLLFFHVIASLSSGTIYKDYIQPPFCFPYIGFEFLQPLPGNGMYYYVGAMGILALLVMLGAWYRLAMTGFAVLWTLLYLMQKVDYNNHYYLILLLSWLMALVPANGYYSIDAARKKLTKTYTCPQWTLWIFAAQIIIVYFFAALGKLNADWFSGKFLSIQFSRLSTHRIIGIFYRQEWFPVFIAYTGFFFDLLIIPLLMWRKTRYYAFPLYCLFHLFNAVSFRIGIFPYLSIALAVFFIEPEKIRSIFFKKKPTTDSADHFTGSLIKRKLLIAGLTTYMLIQIIIPARSWFFPDNVFWTEEGYRMSWKMMMRTKSGAIHFKVIDSTSKKEWVIYPQNLFSPAHVRWISTSPDMIWQYAQRLKKDFVKKGFPNVKVYAIGWVSLNRNKPLPLIDTTVDLSAEKWYPFRHSSWITPSNKTP